ncbi:hypothetical protein DNTS_015412 [Danionella cerebrum]|uniref:Uncharacterized protein n=1 Tax=Danionella cerebrum TaxID=2873325 RepID=A0A553R3T0_9TELE|nr:hypothetical protein DNTS_015412 [Danionella translucida]
MEDFNNIRSLSPEKGERSSLRALRGIWGKMSWSAFSLVPPSLLDLVCEDSFVPKKGSYRLKLFSRWTQEESSNSSRVDSSPSDADELILSESRIFSQRDSSSGGETQRDSIQIPTHEGRRISQVIMIQSNPDFNTVGVIFTHSEESDALWFKVSPEISPGGACLFSSDQPPNMFLKDGSMVLTLSELLSLELS